MGMQVQFSIKEILDQSCVKTVTDQTVEEIDDGEDITYTAVISLPGQEPQSFSYLASYLPAIGNSGTCWFDCGSASESQMALIKWLIRNRICFSAS